MRWTRFDYLLAAMGFALLSGLGYGVASSAPLAFAASGGSLLAGAFMAVGLIYHPGA
ncbi:hypothetical protein ACFQJD_12450 [Haloplanus sp. GCM10025708]|uniref:hypothetical protein n=1 Tax=Haloferacaceae TaxID=1644056 RepID=UPI00361B0B4E